MTEVQQSHREVGLTLSWQILMAVSGDNMAFTPAASAPLHSPLITPAHIPHQILPMYFAGGASNSKFHVACVQKSSQSMAWNTQAGLTCVGQVCGYQG